KRIGRHTVQRFTWDGEDQLVAVETTRHPGTAQASTQTVHLRYDALGRRIAKQDAFGETTFIWEGMRLIEERRGARVASYVYEPGSYVPLARIDADGNRIAEPGQPAAPAPASTSPASGISYFHTDPSGLPEEVTDEGGQVRWRASYRTWGSAIEERWDAVRVDGSPVAAAQQHAQLEALEQNLRLQGQYLDRETGLHYNTFRYYDPDMGRFISPDPIGLAGGKNLNLYAPNPNSWIDPLGLSCGPATRKNSRGQWIDAQGRFAKAPPKPNFTHESYLHEAGYHPNPQAGGHAHGSSQTGKSKFNIGEGGSKFSNEVYNHPNVQAQQQGSGRWRYEVDDLGRPVGTNQAGGTVQGGRVIVEANPSVNPNTYNPGDVVTQFPK
ncbi:RHS domain-containing protein, partial [Acidovorax sp. GBBC 3334]|uniref:RHS repeat-associated core domain-containing protein n=1 Tax=Acidovorax sp. GBBC 3334 TaxID=2940496 RepID=UPI002302DD8A